MASAVYLRPLLHTAGTAVLLTALNLAAVVPALAVAPPPPSDDRLRVIIETDLGGDADDQASLVRFLLYANEWDVEGIIADRHASKFHTDGARDHKGLPASNGYELALAYLDAYAAVYPNLRKHATGYPHPQRLRQLTVPGWNETHEGVRLIIAAADRNDPRPIWYSNWGSNSGSTSNLRRAFDLVKSQRSAAEYEAFVKKFRICTLDGPHRSRQGHETHVALHVETGYPEFGGRWYHRFRPLTERAGGFNVQRDVLKDHGQLGSLYTTPKEGDSWTFVYLIPNGLSDPEQPSWGGWGGRYGLRAGDKRDRSGVKGSQFYWANEQDTLGGETSRDLTASRWAAALQNDFKARLDWCVADRFQEANHPPQPHCQGDTSLRVLKQQAAVGKPLQLSAAGSFDPDDDQLQYRWLVYPEPGTYRGRVKLSGDEPAADEKVGQSSKPNKSALQLGECVGGQEILVHVPRDAAGKSIHIVLIATDNGEPPLTRYRRVVVEAVE